MSPFRHHSCATSASLVLITLLTVRVEAFEYKEHKDVSNQGFDRAQTFIKDTYGKCLAAPRLQEITSLRSGCPFSSTSVSFGDLVALVDYVRDPNDFLDLGGFQSAAPDVFLNENRIERLRKNFVQAVHSAHNDLNHYQDRALSSFWIWHRIARQEAGAPGGGHLRLALFYSAYSIHFLEDFFAPGHIRTPRADLHDAFAMNIHDRFNKCGQSFKVEAKTLPELEPFLASSEYKELQKNKSLFLLGDGGLGYPRVKNPLQATFLAALVGRAIADVFESYLDARSAEDERCCGIDVQNHFEDWEFQRYEVVPEKYVFGRKTMSPGACIRYGCYDRVTRPLPLGPPVVLAIDVGAQTLLGGDTASRAQFESSVGPMVLISPGTNWRKGTESGAFLHQSFAGLEWNHVFAHGYVADGLRARVYFPVTLLDGQVTASTTYRWYRANFGAEERWSWDVGAQFGYGLVFFGGFVGRQDVLNEMNSRLTPAWTLTGNVTLLLSPSIFPKLLKTEHGVTFKP